MPLLVSLGQHAALRAVQGRVEAGGSLPDRPLRWAAQNFVRSFFPLPPQISFSSLSGGLLVEFGGLKRRDAQICAGVLWLSCEAPAARSGGTAGVSHDSPRAQAHSLPARVEEGVLGRCRCGLNLWCQLMGPTFFPHLPQRCRGPLHSPFATHPPHSDGLDHSGCATLRNLLRQLAQPL